MILFNCWYCNRRHTATEAQIGEKRSCGCGRMVRVPSRGGGPSTCKSVTEVLIERLVYGLGGGLIGLILGLVIAHEVATFRTWLYYIGALTVTGLVAGALGGEAGINWIGRKMRQREEK
jgi:hypothetical protein